MRPKKPRPEPARADRRPVNTVGLLRCCVDTTMHAAPGDVGDELQCQQTDDPAHRMVVNDQGMWVRKQ